MLKRLPLLSTLVALGLVGCVSHAPIKTTTLEPQVRAKIERGTIAPGFTPEMVYLALGKPTVPAENIVDGATNGSWIYHDFRASPAFTPRAGYCQRVVFNSEKQREIVRTERIDAKADADLNGDSLRVTFRDGRVVEIQRTAVRGERSSAE